MDLGIPGVEAGKIHCSYFLNQQAPLGKVDRDVLRYRFVSGISGRMIGLKFNDA
jgi:hypothetical protein